MTNKKVTKRALLASTAALILCFSMLLGTTYAWLTDFVTSGSNLIQSGSLDIDVQYTLDGENWYDLENTKTGGEHPMFQKGLGEPGHTEVVALRIKNNGTWALKYVANMNIVSETVGNEANHDGEHIPEIEFGSNVFATQYIMENDSFCNTYDEDAAYPPVIVSNFAELAAALKMGGDIKLGADISLEANDYMSITNAGHQKRLVIQDVTVTLDLHGYNNNGRYEGSTLGIEVFGGKFVNHDLSKGTAGTNYYGDKADLVNPAYQCVKTGVDENGNTWHEVVAKQ